MLNNKTNNVECKLHTKILNQEPLSEQDIHTLSLVIKEQLKFMIKNNILPFPENYEKWFFIFCYAIESGISLEDERLFDLYISFYKEESSKYIFMNISNVIEALDNVAEDLHLLLKENKNYSHKKEIELSSIKDLEKGSEIIENTVISLISHLKDIQKKNEELLKQVKKQKNVIKSVTTSIKRLELEANLDYLTGINNRRSVARALDEYFKEFCLRKTKFSVILIDIDNFKQINDRYGHLIGDRVLVKVARTIRSSTRAKDIIGRWGGDEFIVILPNTDRETANKVKERIKSNIGHLNIYAEGELIKVSVSIGTAEVSERHQNIEALLTECDIDMYRNKESASS